MISQSSQPKKLPSFVHPAQHFSSIHMCSVFRSISRIPSILIAGMLSIMSRALQTLQRLQMEKCSLFAHLSQSDAQTSSPSAFASIYRNLPSLLVYDARQQACC
jgi:hypothetical protein